MLQGERGYFCLERAVFRNSLKRNLCMRYCYQSMEGILTVKFDSIKASWAQVIAYE